MSDIFNEVDEEVRREQLKKLWDRYGNLVLVAAVLVVLGVGGWRGYQYWEGKKAAEAGAAYDAAAELIDQGKSQEAEQAFNKVATDGTAGYRTLARLRAAATLGERDRAAAVAAYDAIANDGSADKVLRDLASVRAGFLLVDTASLADITKRIEPLAQSGGAFRHSAREILAVAAVRAADRDAAKRWFDAVLGDAETPQGIRARIDILMTLTDGPKS